MTPRLTLDQVPCRYGAPMGRADTLPDDLEDEVELFVAQMPLVDGDYDEGGAYWGGGDHKIGWMFCAYSTDNRIQVFARALTAQLAAAKVYERIPGLTAVQVVTEDGNGNPVELQRIEREEIMAGVRWLEEKGIR